VADPKTLMRVVGRPECLLRGPRWWAKDGNYSLFPTAAYEDLRRALPEFEELAAIQAGFSFRPVTVRRDGADMLPKSTMGEFGVSGELLPYVRACGPQIGRLFNDKDDVPGAPMTAGDQLFGVAEGFCRGSDGGWVARSGGEHEADDDCGRGPEGDSMGGPSAGDSSEVLPFR